MQAWPYFSPVRRYAVPLCRGTRAVTICHTLWLIADIPTLAICIGPEHPQWHRHLVGGWITSWLPLVLNLSNRSRACVTGRLLAHKRRPVHYKFNTSWAGFAPDLIVTVLSITRALYYSGRSAVNLI